MFWFFYLVALIVFSYLITQDIKNNFFILSFIIIVLLTPGPIETTSSELAPSFYIFIFNILFEQEFSMKPLRPLLISTPICLAFLLIISRIKKRFF